VYLTERCGVLNKKYNKDLSRNEHYHGAVIMLRVAEMPLQT